MVILHFRSCRPSSTQVHQLDFLELSTDKRRDEHKLGIVPPHGGRSGRKRGRHICFNCACPRSPLTRTDNSREPGLQFRLR